MKKIGIIFIGLLGLAVQPAFADALGFANGRSANNDNLSGLSVEGGLSFGDDYTVIGARINYKITPDIVLYGDLANVDVDNADSGFGWGVGAFYQLRNLELLANTDFGVKASFHSVSVDVDTGFGGDVDFDVTEFTVEALISGDKLSTTNFGWYANAGIHIIGVEVESFDDDDTEIGFGGGITGGLGFGEWYAGADFIDDLILRAGVRYNIN